MPLNSNLIDANTYFYRTRSVVIRKKSKTAGVVITQYDTNIPEGNSTPDIVRKPVSLAVQEGELVLINKTT